MNIDDKNFNSACVYYKNTLKTLYRIENSGDVKSYETTYRMVGGMAKILELVFGSSLVEDLTNEAEVEFFK